MKKIIILPTIILSLLFGGAVFAQEVEPLAVSQVELPEVGMTPDSSFYFFKTWKEQIQLFFTFGKENKAKQHLHLSEVRLAEYQKMIEKGKTEIAQKTFEKYEKQLNHALEKAGEAKEKGKSVTKLEEEIGEKILKHQEMFKGVEAMEVSTKEHKKALEALKQKKVSGQTYEGLEAKCLEQGGPPELCIMKTGQTYKDLEIKCLESGGPPEICTQAEEKCKLVGAKTADECERINLETFLNMEPKALKLKAESQKGI